IRGGGRRRPHAGDVQLGRDVARRSRRRGRPGGWTDMDRESGGGGIDGSSSGVGEREMTTLTADSPSPSVPVVRRSREGVVAGLSVDRVVADGDFLAVSGWAIGGQDLTFTVASSAGVSVF